MSVTLYWLHRRKSLLNKYLAVLPHWKISLQLRIINNAICKDTLNILQFESIWMMRKNKSRFLY